MHRYIFMNDEGGVLPESGCGNTVSQLIFDTPWITLTIMSVRKRCVHLSRRAGQSEVAFHAGKGHFDSAVYYFGGF